MRPRLNRRSLLVIAVAAAAGLVTSACNPLVNPPPGGGETITETFRYGPITIAPDGRVAGAPSSGMPRPAGAFGLKSAQFAVVDGSGRELTGDEIMLHHFVVTTSARQDQICPSRRERLMGSGNERTSIGLWGPYTYLVGADDQWGSLYEMMNMTSTQRQVYIQYKLSYQPGANSTNSRPVVPYYQDVAGCSNSFDVPGNGGPDSIYSKSVTLTAPSDGYAIYTGGHLHDGGIDVKLENTTKGTAICTNTATYDDMGMITSIKPCHLHSPLSAGDKIKATARYDNSRPLQDVMGVAFTYVWWGTQ